MKGFAFIALSLILCTSLAATTEETFTEYIKGFLSGVSEKGSIEDLKKCIKDGDAIIVKIKSGLEDISSMKDTSIKTGLTTLFAATKEMLEMVKACSSSFSVLNNLGNKIASADIAKLTRKVMSSPGTYFHLSIDGLEGFKNQKFATAGISVGTIERLLLLSRLEAPTMVDFILGMLTGINEKGDINKVKTCAKEEEAIIEKMKEACSYIRNMQMADLVKGAGLLLEATKMVIQMIKPCADGLTAWKKVADGVAVADPNKLAKKMFSSAGAFFHLAIDTLEGIQEKNYLAAGKAVGTMLKLLFIDRSNTQTAFFDFIKGFFEGINEGGDINKILDCLKEGEAIIAKVTEALECIMKMDVVNVMKGIMMLVDVVKQIGEKLKPCTEGYTQLEKLLKAVMNANFMEIVAKVMKNSFVIIAEIMDFISVIKSGSYEKAGKDLGDILFLIFLAKSS